MIRIACLVSLVVFVAVCGRSAAAEETASADLKREYDSKEKEAVEIAREMKNAPRPPDNLKARLRQTVAEAFALRQRLHQAELAEFQERMTRVQQTLRNRDEIKDAIIDRRVEDLLNPDLNWERPADSAAPGPTKSAPKKANVGETPGSLGAANPFANSAPESVGKKRGSFKGGTEVGVVSAKGEEGLFVISCKIPGDLRVGEELQLYRPDSQNPDVRRAVGWVVVVELKDEETAIGRATDMPRVLRNNRYGPDKPYVGDFVVRPNYQPESPADPTGEGNKASSPPPAKPVPSPRIVRSVPAMGATDVDPRLTEVLVTFDQEMSKGMSWTGDGALYFPPPQANRQALWLDNRTCLLPVKLEPGRFYRVGINSSSHTNFRSLDDRPVPPGVIWFATMGATPEVAAAVSVPKVVSIEPANGATDVDPEVNALRVTFNMPMGDGMSWTGGGEKYPKPRPGSRARWSADGLTCILPVTLEPGHDYELGLNSANHINFQSRWGVPLEPVVYKFRTRDETP